MNITRKSLTSAGCGIVLTTGLFVILVLITGPFIHDLPASIQKSIPMFIFFFSLLIIAPLLSMRLYRLDDTGKILGWTFIGTGAEIAAFPFSLLFIMKSIEASGALLVTLMIVASSFIFCIPAGMISISAGILIIKHP